MRTKVPSRGLLPSPVAAPSAVAPLPAQIFPVTAMRAQHSWGHGTVARGVLSWSPHTKPCLGLLSRDPPVLPFLDSAFCASPLSVSHYPRPLLLFREAEFLPSLDEQPFAPPPEHVLSQLLFCTCSPTRLPQMPFPPGKAKLLGRRSRPSRCQTSLVSASTSPPPLGLACLVLRSPYSPTCNQRGARGTRMSAALCPFQTRPRASRAPTGPDTSAMSRLSSDVWPLTPGASSLPLRNPQFFLPGFHWQKERQKEPPGGLASSF